MTLTLRIALPVLSLLTLAACGADGDPVPPPAKPAPPAGITLSGEAAFGVTTQ